MGNHVKSQFGSCSGLIHISSILLVATICGVWAYWYSAGDFWSSVRHPPDLHSVHQSSQDSDTNSLYYVSDLWAIPSPQDQLQKIAFIFQARGPIPFESLWRRFFAGQDERYSLYVHVNSENFTFPETSLFYQKEVPSKNVTSRSVDTLRWLLAVALHDSKNYNTWFVNVCEATIPLRSFNSTFDYLTSSHHSFVQSFYPMEKYRRLETLPEFDQLELRKGEVWMALQRQHADTIVNDRALYTKFASQMQEAPGEAHLAFEEGYFQTLLHLQDPGGIANRTVMFVDWSDGEQNPRIFDSQNILSTESFLHKMVTATTDPSYGAHYHSAADNGTVHCTHNGVEVFCFLFARKFLPDCLEMLIGLQIPNI